ncbi:hypothetical protein CPB84DRAFT_944680 [Gymnopilus junonius]|uniref:Uncharacterized protein n=1 Tax=Gymnopilus junonius TaxID=109634 RepID=A0A9P5NNV1_GYMJU|nr:hypothetical protein CPB84DRAFT_944680 [Gymnopilus junonius]
MTSNLQLTLACKGQREQAHCSKTVLIQLRPALELEQIEGGNGVAMVRSDDGARKKTKTPPRLALEVRSLQQSKRTYNEPANRFASSLGIRTHQLGLTLRGIPFFHSIPIHQVKAHIIIWGRGGGLGHRPSLLTLVNTIGNRSLSVGLNLTPAIQLMICPLNPHENKELRSLFIQAML